jgi:hypothetical protein
MSLRHLEGEADGVTSVIPTPLAMAKTNNSAYRRALEVDKSKVMDINDRC